MNFITYRSLYAALSILIAWLAWIPRANGDESLLSGQLQARIDGRMVQFPSLEVDVKVDVRGDLAEIEVHQIFVNPTTSPMEATYLFPLNKDAAVYDMTMEVGEERLKAEISEKQEALATYQKAKSEGKAAALLEQHRPNMFTQKIANLVPHMPIHITIKYTHTIKKVDGEYELVVPLVVGPRFRPSKAGKLSQADPGEIEKSSETLEAGSWKMEQLPEAPPVYGLDIPNKIERNRVSLNINLKSVIPFQKVYSRTHNLESIQDSPHQKSFKLATGKAINNRDFVLRYQIAQDKTQTGLLTYKDERGGFFSLMIEPPISPKDEQITPREVVFVLDCSGSMYGTPMNASKRFMEKALHGLRSKDYFRIIRFSDAATEFSQDPLPATQANIQKGLAYTESLRGGGGTVMSSGINQALLAPQQPNTMRIVVFLTDGYIGNELEIIRIINEKIGDARLFAFGVGSAVNRFLLDKMGKMGRGFTRYMNPTDNIEDLSSELAQRIDAPVFTDIEINYGSLDPDSLTPIKIPDLFAGGSVRIQGRYDKPGKHRILANGKINGHKVTLPLDLNFPSESKGGESIALIWARSSIESNMDEFAMPYEWRDPKRANRDLKEDVIELGLNYKLVTKWTSFVAVSEKILNPDPKRLVHKNIPLPMVEGVSQFAYPNNSGKKSTDPFKSGVQGAQILSPTSTLLASNSLSPSSTGSFSGFSAPEPEAFVGLFLTFILGGIASWRRRRSQSEV